MGCTPGEHQVPRVPKKEGAINPINRAVSWRCSLSPRANIERFSLNYCPFEAAFSGIGRDLQPAYYDIFLYFILHSFMATHSEWGRKTMLT